MKIKLYQVDAFTERPFTGNPAAICLPEHVLDAPTMQAIAAENNLAETAFLEETQDGFSLRWFTPTVEVDLCGHATLASAHILWETGRLPETAIARFQTRSGLLTAAKKDGWIELDFPALPAEQNGPVQLPQNISQALNITPSNTAIAEGWYLIELENEETVMNLQPEFSLLEKEAPVIITSRSAQKYDFISRFFAPSHGINEDPVTGSAHCRLGPYWAEKLGKNELRAFQASARGGELKLKVEGERVKIAGQAITVIEGTFLLKNEKSTV